MTSIEEGTWINWVTVCNTFDHIFSITETVAKIDNSTMNNTDTMYNVYIFLLLLS